MKIREYIYSFTSELTRLAIPPLLNKSFLEIGCGEGFFCGYAYFEGASKIIGLDKNEDNLAIAKSRFPYCIFLNHSVNLAKIIASEEKFDVILCSTSSDELQLEAHLPLLMKCLNQNGTLIAKSAFSTSPDKLFADYVYKSMSESVFRSKDQTPLCIYHVKNRLPYAVLLMGKSGSGKSTATRQLFPGLSVIRGDEVMRELADLDPHSLDGKFNYLGQICSGPDNKLTVGGIMIEIFNSAAGKEYACLIADLAEHKDFVYDGVIHENFRHVFVAQLTALGYQVLTLETPDPIPSPNALFKQANAESKKYSLYLDELLKPE